MLSKIKKVSSCKPSVFHRKLFIFLGFGLFFLYFLPLIVNGENSYVVIHDNLDSEVVWRVVLSSNHRIVNNAGIELVPQIMDGIPRSDMISELNFIMLLFNIFSPFYAYLINHIIVHLVALLGMFLFTNHYLLPKQNQEANFTLISLGIALAFGVLPFYTMYGLSIAGQPILIYSFLNIANDKGKFTDFLILSAFPLYSYLFLDGVFFNSRTIFDYAIFCGQKEKIGWGVIFGLVDLLSPVSF